MVKLKNKIKIIDSLPSTNKKNISAIKIISLLLLTIIVSTVIYILFLKIMPYLNAINVDKIAGKKINITECNTKDYIIIGKDKSYSLSLTNNNCETNYYEGTATIKNNEIIFNKNIKGIIDNNYNISINQNIFESDKNE